MDWLGIMFLVLAWFGLTWFGIAWFASVWLGFLWFSLVWFVFRGKVGNDFGERVPSPRPVSRFLLPRNRLARAGTMCALAAACLGGSLGQGTRRLLWRSRPPACSWTCCAEACTLKHLFWDAVAREAGEGGLQRLQRYLYST